ncbi:tautomerase family protein [Bosea sp. PAMC 26642]|uniref:tautomerase family protein n=1 Tax=Bosea sp. (strain PAMC 26642) TaxID=1792307 RepID=UPI0007701F28|nr:tautomerase family protein [Bosea sp. PAMC 26642]AMJ62296.1 4-oxalocrotonate tautomerase [Bosea sp. PAMC 26642]
MPFVRTSMPMGTEQTQKLRIVQGIHEALVESIGMPKDELFNLVTEYGDGEFFYNRSFNGIARSETLIVVEITMRRGRSDAMKRDLYAAISRNLEATATVSPKDIFIFMHENDYSDWSVGNGVFAMAIAQQRGTDG